MNATLILPDLSAVEGKLLTATFDQVGLPARRFLDGPAITSVGATSKCNAPIPRS
jgi:hypothetical protein